MTYEKHAKLSIENVIKEGLNDVFDRPFEIELLNNNLFVKNLYAETIKRLNGNSFESLKVQNLGHVLLPKNSPFNFRRCALIQPMDLVLYQSLVLSIADTIENNRISITKKRIFSYRYKPSKGYLFNKNYTITSFYKHSRERAKMRKVKFIVSCDIANYYDRLNLHRLQNTLLSIECDKTVVKTLNELLLFWSNRDSYSLPVGSNASRILAEANLIGVDNYLESLGVDFIRFVDDYRLFAPDIHTAHYWLTLLIERLWQEGLTINMGKTKIVEKTEFINSSNKNPVEEIEPVQNIKTNNDNKLYVVKKNGSKTSDNSDIKENKNPFIIIAGYSGLVPIRFRKISETERDKLKLQSLELKLDEIQRKKAFEVEELVELIKIVVAKDEFDYFEKIIDLSNNYIQLTPYIIDAIIKNSENLSDSLCEKIRNFYSEKIKSNKKIPEYLMLEYIRILGSVKFENKALLLELFRELKRNAGAYLGRALLDSLSNISTREDAIEIRNSYYRSDSWEKRAIVKIVKLKVDEEERKAWIRNIKHLDTSDIFLDQVIEPSKKNSIKSKNNKNNKNNKKK